VVAPTTLGTGTQFFDILITFFSLSSSSFLLSLLFLLLSLPIISTLVLLYSSIPFEYLLDGNVDVDVRVAVRLD